MCERADERRKSEEEGRQGGGHGEETGCASPVGEAACLSPLAILIEFLPCRLT
jgi:hypothetical protein